MSTWCRQFNRIFLTLEDVRVDLRLTINRRRFTLRASLRENREVTGEDQKDEPDSSPASTEPRTETHSQTFGWHIEARGRLHKDSIGLLRPNEGISGHSKRFETLKVFLSPISISQEETSGGTIFSCDSTYETTVEPCLCLYLQVPGIELQKICDELLAGRIRTLQLTAEIDSFESESDRSVWQPPAPKHFYIDEDSLENKAYLVSLIGSRHIAG